MSPNEQTKWWHTYSAFHQSRENTWQPVLFKTIQSQIKPSIAILQENGIQAAISNLDRTVPLEPISKVIKNIYIDAGTVFGGKAYQMVKKQAAKLQPRKQLAELSTQSAFYEYLEDNFEAEISIDHKRLMPIGFNEQLVNDIINYYNLYLLSKAVIPITETTKQFILQQLIQGQQEGLSIQQIVNALENTDITRNRARLIARTETAKAANFSAVWGARKTGYQSNKVWIASRDFRTRRIPRDEFSHLVMNGQEVHLDEAFQVPRKEGGYELMQQPGDVNGSAADTIRCRCVVGFKILRDHAGRPLRV